MCLVCNERGRWHVEGMWEQGQTRWATAWSFYFSPNTMESTGLRRDLVYDFSRSFRLWRGE